MLVLRSKLRRTKWLQQNAYRHHSFQVFNKQIQNTKKSTLEKRHNFHLHTKFGTNTAVLKYIYHSTHLQSFYQDDDKSTMSSYKSQMTAVVRPQDETWRSSFTNKWNQTCKSEDDLGICMWRWRRPSEFLSSLNPNERLDRLWTLRRHERRRIHILWHVRVAGRVGRATGVIAGMVAGSVWGARWWSVWG